MIKKLGVLALIALMLSTVEAAERNDLGSCYDRVRLGEYKPAPSGRLLTLVVDQTVKIPEDMQRSVWGSVTRFIKPGDQIKVYSFSAFVQGEYMRLLVDATLDTAPSESTRNKMNMGRLRALDRCLQQQQQQFISVVGGQFVNALREASEELPRSEIMHALREIGQDIQRKSVEDRVLYLLSDMLENSAYTSFYANNRIRAIDTDRELALVENHDLFADLHNVRVYVAGAGLVSSSSRNAYRSSKTMDNLSQFWHQYFNRSGAKLEGFGMPQLNMEIH